MADPISIALFMVIPALIGAGVNGYNNYKQQCKINEEVQNIRVQTENFTSTYSKLLDNCETLTKDLIDTSSNVLGANSFLLQTAHKNTVTYKKMEMWTSYYIIGFLIIMIGLLVFHRLHVHILGFSV